MRVLNPIANSYTKNQANSRFITVDTNDVNQGEPPISIETKLVPAGGTTGQVLTKSNDTDYATQWSDPAGGGGSLVVGTARTSLNEIVFTDGATITGSGSHLGLSFTQIKLGYTVQMPPDKNAILFNNGLESIKVLSPSDSATWTAGDFGGTIIIF